MRRPDRMVPRRRTRALASIACLAAIGALPASVDARQEAPTCRDAAASLAEGWAGLRSGRLVEARESFAAASTCPRQRAESLTGLGFVALREDAVPAARDHFAAALDAAEGPGPADARYGLALVAWRTGDRGAAAREAGVALELVPGHADAAELLSAIVPRAYRPARSASSARPGRPRLTARATSAGFEVDEGDGWRKMYVRGVNLGAALPGRHPSEFPDSATYAAWIAAIGELGANAIRVYTIHPPSFYSALAAYNRSASRAIWLIHGVWAELPPGDDFTEAGWEQSFFDEMRRVVDVVHGQARLGHRPGHASGDYTADVSRWTLGYIFGREWEPFSVASFNEKNAALVAFEGRYLRVKHGTPMDVWLARAAEEMIAYETLGFGWQRPIAYTNWPTTDPLTHSTETTKAEELELRARLGETPDRPPKEYDNDAVSLDPEVVESTAAFEAGTFASYHAYPYYPDFMNLDPAYSAASSSLGPSNYFGYLRALRRHHERNAVLISEYGLPAGRVSAHFQNQGWDHGGLTESRVAEGVTRMTREIEEAGMAGGVVFAWIDEWFKKNWLVIDLELPADRNRLWLNRLDAEQQYGLIAMEPATVLEGASAAERWRAWKRRAPLANRARPRGAPGPTLPIRATVDEASLWLLIERGASPPGEQGEIYVGFDLVPGAGDRRLPGRVGPELPVGLERVLHIGPAGARILVDPPSNPWVTADVIRTPARDVVVPRLADRDDPRMFVGRVESRLRDPVRSVPNADGRYDSMRVVINRVRFGRDGREYLATGMDIGVLRQGPLPDGDWETFEAEGRFFVEVRIPWTLLGITDPSSRRYLHAPHAAGMATHSRADDRSVFRRDAATVSFDSIGIVVALADRAAVPGTGVVLDPVVRFSWAEWETPAWKSRRRPAYEALQRVYTGARTDGGATYLETAERAWLSGDYSTAEAEYEAGLAGGASDRVARHRLALLHAWKAEYDTALEHLARLEDAEPQSAEAARTRALVLSWSGRLPEAEALYDSLRHASPDDREAALGYARVLAWRGRLAAAEAEYEAALAADPDDVEALAGYARVAAWNGRLQAAEGRWRDAISRHPQSAELLLGLSRTLRWQGRAVSAATVLEQASAVAPDHREVRAEERTLAASMRPAAEPAAGVEWDADGNVLLTASAALSLRPSAGVRVGIGLTRVEAWAPERYAAAQGMSVSVEAPIGRAGWVGRAEIGAAGRDGAGRDLDPITRLSVASPGHRSVSGSVSLKRQALLAGAAIIGNDVAASAARLDGRIRITSKWSLDAQFEVGAYSGTRTNRRIAAAASVTRRVSRSLHVGLRGRGYGFRLDLSDGYFDPDRYIAVELPVQWRRQYGRAWLATGAALGVERPRGGAEVRETFRVHSDLTYEFSPGRSATASGALARSGLRAGSATDGYWYASAALRFRWAF